MTIGDFSFQILLLLAGALIGVFAQLSTVPQQKLIARVLAILVLAVTLFWTGYIVGFHQGSAATSSSASTIPNLALNSNTPSSGNTSESGTSCPEDPTDVILEFGRVVTYAICPQGDTDTFRFSGSSGDRIRIQVTYKDGTMRPCIELIAPDNTRPSACENAFNNVIDMRLEQTGSYTIVVDVLLSGEGNYTLVVERL